MRLLLPFLVACAAAPVAPVASVVRVAPVPAPAPSAPATPAPDRPRWIGVALAPGSLRVSRIFDRTPAASAGLEVGDEITEVDGHTVTSLAEFRAAIENRPIGRPVPFTILRAQTPRQLAIAIAERPDLEAMASGQLLGKPAPPFALTALDGAAVTLAALHGSVIVLDFWATWCGPCEVAHPLLVAFHARHPEVVLLGISDEDEQIVRDHGASPYPLARDATGQLARDYLVPGIPHVVLIDRLGLVRYIGGGIAAVRQLEAELAKLP